MDDPKKMERFLERDPALRMLRLKKRRGWIDDERYEERLGQLRVRRMRSLKLDPGSELPPFLIPLDFGSGETGVYVGNPVHEDVVMANLYLPFEEATECHVGFWGKSRWGKTYEMCHLLAEVSSKETRTFVAYDLQNELAGILGNLLPEGRLLHIAFKDYWKNPLQEIYERGLDTAIGDEKRALMESQFIGAQPLNLMEKVVRRRCTAEKLAALGPPSRKELLYLIKRLEEERGTGRGAWHKGLEYLHSLINIEENLSLNLSLCHNRPIARGFTFRDFEGLVVVIDISSIRDPISMKFFVTKELLDIALYAEGRHPPMTALVDETHLWAPLEKQYGAYTNPIVVQAAKTFLKYGVNLWLAEQNPGQFIHPAILANVGTHFCFRLPSVKDRWPVMYAMNVSDREQADFAGSLEKMHCLLYSDSLGGAVLIRTPRLEIQDMRERVVEGCAPIIKRYHERFLKERPAGMVKADETVTGRDKEVTPGPVQELTKRRIARHRIDYPLSGITESYMAAGISPEIGRRHLKEMLDLGWLEGPERMPTAGRGHKTVDCYAVTEKGCKSLGIEWKKSRLPGKGSLRSRLAARMIGVHLESKGKTVRYEYTLATGELAKAADAALLEVDGSVTAFEYQGNARVIDNIVKNHRAGFNRSVVVCANKRALDAARKKAKEELEGSLFNATEFRTLKEFAS